MAAIPSPVEAQTRDAAHRSRTPSPRPQRAEIIAITGDDSLLEQIGKVLDGESTVRQADTTDEARELLRPAQPSVVLLDSRGQENLDRLVQDLQALEGSRVVIVFAPTGQTEDVARSVRGSAVFAVLGIPMETAQAGAVIEGACEEVLARQALLAAPPPAAPAPSVAPALAPPRAPIKAPPVVAVAPVADHAPLTGRSAKARRPVERKPLVLAMGGVLLAVALVSWLSLRSSKPDVASTPEHSDAVPLPAPSAIPATPASAAPSAAPVPLAAGSVDDLLDSARTAMHERRYTDPEGNNALHFYTSALAQEPGNGEALEGLQRIAAVLRERLQSALDEHHVDEAAQTLAHLRVITPNDPTLAALEVQLTEARIAKTADAGDVARATELLKQAEQSKALPADRAARWQADLDRRQSAAQAGQLAQLVSLRIRQGRLLDPAGDSARYYVGQLRRMPAAQGLANAAAAEYQQACLSRLRDATLKGQRAEVDRWKAEARAAGVGAAELANVQRDAGAQAKAQETDREIARVAQLVQDRIADGRLLEPAGDSAVFHMATLRRLDTTGNVASVTERALSTRLLDSGHAALQAGQIGTAKTFASAARQLGSNLEAVGGLEREVAVATVGNATAPIQLVRTRFVAPVYPKEALEQKLKGNVHLQITVEAEGKVKDAVVTQSDLPKAFNDAAVDAARRWRFKPIGTKGSDVESTANVTIVFQPEAAQP